VAAGHYSRYPVYQDTIDHVVGVLHTKDLLALVARRPALLTEGNGAFDLSSVLRAPLYFPAMASVDRVLEHMRRTQTHLTIVIDEFGGMAGIATMEDILEELVGEVQDEFDAEPAPVWRAEGVIGLDGLVTKRRGGTLALGLRGALGHHWRLRGRMPGPHSREGRQGPVWQLRCLRGRDGRNARGAGAVRPPQNAV
jgi:hypothetical protein